jgi:hypothetical protein
MQEVIIRSNIEVIGRDETSMVSYLATSIGSDRLVILRVDVR